MCCAKKLLTRKDVTVTCCNIILLSRLPITSALISHRGTLCFGWWSSVLAFDEIKSNSAGTLPWKRSHVIGKKLLCRYAVTKISSCKEPETKLLRQNLQTWPDEIKKSCPCVAQRIVLCSGSGSEVRAGKNPKSAEFVQLLFVVYQWLLPLIIFGRFC